MQSNLHDSLERWKRKEAEQATIGSCLRDNAVIADVFQILSPSDFWFPAHRLLAQAILDLHRDRRSADLVIVAELLHDRGQMKDAGGAPYLGELWDAAPTAANAFYYAKIVAEAALKRNLALCLDQMACDVQQENCDSEELLQRCERKILSLASNRHQQDSVSSRQVALEEAEYEEQLHDGHASPGLLTGFHGIDDLLTGLPPSQLIVIAARPSVGKTALATCIIGNVASQGHPVFFASLEQPRVDIAQRFLCQLGGIHSQRLRKGSLSDDERQRLTQARERFAALPFYIDDSSHQSMLRINSNARRHWQRDKAELVVVDYLQLVQPEDKKAHREEQVATIALRLKELARELKIPVIALAQLNRKAEDRGKPMLADLRDSGMIEAHADVVMLLHRTQQTGSGQIIDVLIEKQRNGPTGEASLLFRKECVRFEDLAPDFV